MITSQLIYQIVFSPLAMGKRLLVRVSIIQKYKIHLKCNRSEILIVIFRCGFFKHLN